MEESTLFLISLGVVLLIIVLFLIQFTGEGGVELSIFKWIKLKIWEKKPQSLPEPPKMDRGSNNKPDLSLQLIDRRGGRSDRIQVDLRRIFPESVDFRLALVNNAPSTKASGVAIRLEFYWRGSSPTKAPRFFRPFIPVGWEIERVNIVEDRPAVLRFSSPDIVSLHGHTHDLDNLHIQISEELKGFFLLKYTVSSFEPFSESEGDLRIDLNYV